jgi:hypothetical protein
MHISTHIGFNNKVKWVNPLKCRMSLSVPIETWSGRNRNLANI